MPNTYLWTLGHKLSHVENPCEYGSSSDWLPVAVEFFLGKADPGKFFAPFRCISLAIDI